MAKNMTAGWEHTQEQINDYLAGRMDEVARESFERRMFAEPDLSVEVERAAEVMAALRERTASRPGMRWMPLAAAAALMALAIGVWIGVPVTDTGDTPRGGSVALALELAADDGVVSVRWQAVAGAASYEFRVYLDDGSLAYERFLPGDSTGHRLSFDAPHEGNRLLRVRALDSFRNVRADSGLVPLPGD